MIFKLLLAILLFTISQTLKIAPEQQNEVSHQFLKSFAAGFAAARVQGAVEAQRDKLRYGERIGRLGHQGY